MKHVASRGRDFLLSCSFHFDASTSTLIITHITHTHSLLRTLVRMKLLIGALVILNYPFSFSSAHRFFNNHKTLVNMSSEGPKQKKWFPLESNPELLNKYISKLGFDTSLYSFTDVFSTEEWALGMIPPGTAAVVFLYPLTNVQEDFRAKEKDELETQEVDAAVWHIKQRIGNACGTIGILHALANVPEPLKVATIPADSWLGKFYESCPSQLSSVAKADILEGDTEIASKHDAATSDEQNQTNRGALDDQLITHFVAIVNVNGKLYELDGRKVKPVNHGDTTQESFLKDCANVVQKFMDRDPTEMRFTILALAPTQF